jgi:hypothetical protein
MLSRPLENPAAAAALPLPLIERLPSIVQLLAFRTSFAGH